MSKAATLKGVGVIGLSLVGSLLCYQLYKSTQPPLPEEQVPKVELFSLFDAEADARENVAAARAHATRRGKFLIVIFGANWCMDCRTLYRRLNSREVADYTDDLFDFAHVDVGNFDRNLDVTKDLGVSLERGIPVALAFNRDGALIGTTNNGELDPARFYSSKQILRFVRNIAERSKIVAPDSAD